MRTKNNLTELADAHAARTCFKNSLNKIYINKKLIDNSFIFVAKMYTF